MHFAPCQLIIVHQTDIQFIRSSGVRKRGSSGLFKECYLVIDADGCYKGNDQASNQELGTNLTHSEAYVRGCTYLITSNIRRGIPVVHHSVPVIRGKPVVRTTKVDRIPRASHITLRIRHKCCLVGSDVTDIPADLPPVSLLFRQGWFENPQHCELYSRPATG